MSTKSLNKQTITQVTLDQPIQRGDELLEEISVRQPRAGELRGIYLDEVLRMNADAYPALLERITDPVLTKAEFDGLSVIDLVALMTAVMGFFSKPSAR